MPDSDAQTIAPPLKAAVLARWVLVPFLLTFMATRCLVYLIMSRRIPDLYLYVGGTHVHHLNHGIILLSSVGAYLLFRRPSRREQLGIAVLYGIGLALTFDEFGMRLHLGGGYWQRASFDAIAVIAAAFALVAAAPGLRHFRTKHWSVFAILLAATMIFTYLLVRSLSYADRNIRPRLERLEQSAPQ